MDFVELYDQWSYKLSFRENLRSYKDWLTAEKLVYGIKNIITNDDFKIKNTDQVKKLTFYYFYLSGGASFTNGYSFSFNKEKLHVDINFFEEYEQLNLSDFQQYFHLWRNDIFLSKVVDTSIGQDISTFREGAKEVDNIIDFFTYFLHENLELYSLAWEHFPLFKWIINELMD